MLEICKVVIDDYMNIVYFIVNCNFEEVVCLWVNICSENFDWMIYIGLILLLGIGFVIDYIFGIFLGIYKMVYL